MKNCGRLRVMDLFHFLLPLTALVLLACPVHAAGPPTRSFIAPPTGSFPGSKPGIRADLHLARTTRIATDAKGRWLVTASHDEIALIWEIKVWEVNSGRLRKVLRPPLGKGGKGKLHDVALSPDGAMVAVAGWTGYDWDRTHSIDLLKRSGGQLLRRIPGLPSAIRRLAFSPDDRWLAVSLEGKHGVRIFEVKSGRGTGQDLDYGDDSYCIDFSPDGRKIVTTSHDGQVRLYMVENGALQKLKQATAPGGKIPFIARFSPDGKQIALLFKDTTALNVLDAGTLSPAFARDTRGLDNRDLGAVAWSADGQFLYAAGSWDINGHNPVRRWSAGGRGAYTDVPVAYSRVTDLVSLPDGRIVFALVRGSPGWGLLSKQGHCIQGCGQGAVLPWGPQQVLSDREATVSHRISCF